MPTSTSTNVEREREFEQKISRALMQGVVAQITLSMNKHLDFLSAAYMLLVLVPATIVAQLLRAPEIIQDLVFSTALTTAMNLVSTDKDQGVALINVLAVYLLGTAIQSDDSDVCTSAQYILAGKVTSLIQLNSPLVGMVIAAGLYTHQAWLATRFPRLYNVLTLVLMSIVQDWFLKQIPNQFESIVLLVVLYGLSALLEYSVLAANAYNFVIMTAARSFKVTGLPYWVQSVLFSVVWLARVDDMAQTFAQMVAVRMLQLTMIDMLAPMGATDPVLVYTLLVVFLQFLLAQLDRTSSPKQK